MSDIESAQKRKVRTAMSPHGMVSTASAQATGAGVKMLEKGGNAVDAAVAAAFCLGVTEFQSSGLGGQSMILIHQGGEKKSFSKALDGSSRAPFGINPNRLPDKPLKLGIMATTVPSTPAVLGYFLDKYGTMPLGEVLKPAINYAEKGLKITSLQRKLLARECDRISDSQFKAIFTKDGAPLYTGAAVHQENLAKCLTTMAESGWKDFYIGEIGEKIVADMKKRGGLISKADLQQIPYPVEREVLKSSYRKLNLITFPPPGAGRTLVQIMNTLENFAPGELDPNKDLFPVILAMTYRAALVKNERLPMDPALYLQMGDKRMVDKKNARYIASRIKKMFPYLDSDHYRPPGVSGETTHVSVADSRDCFVGITQSIELAFGAKTMAEGLGFFYNNYMSAFHYKDMMHPSYLIPGGRPWSSVAPTIIFRDDKSPYLLLGSPGSERISTTLSQVITRVIDAGQDLAAAIDAPRLHAGSTGKILIERRAYAEKTVEILGKAGFEVSKKGAYSFYLGCVQAVEAPVSPGQQFYGVADPRRDGDAMGPRTITEGLKPPLREG